MQRDELTIKVNKCQQGDPEAFSWLVSEYGPRLYRYFHRHSGSAQEAEDLLQDMFVKLVEKIRDYRHQGLFEAWLFRVAANLSRDRARRGQKRISRAVSLNASQDGQGSLIDTLESAEKTRNINDPKNSKYFLAAYHKACIQCHRSLLKQRDRLEKSGILDDNILPEYGPVACVECHFEN